MDAHRLEEPVKPAARGRCLVLLGVSWSPLTGRTVFKMLQAISATVIEQME